jgi:hypothetical protein
VYIYALCESDGETVRYVGKTVDLYKRYNQHMRSAKSAKRTRKSNWIKHVLGEGAQPIMRELECVPPSGDWEARERYWIAYYRELGFDLTNLTDGGEGTSGMPKSEEWRRKASEAHAGMKASDETRRKLSEAHVGYVMPEEQRQKISAALTGRTVSDDTKEKLRQATLSRERPEGFTFEGRQHTEETKERLREASTGHKHSDETRLKMSESRRGKSPSPEAVEARREGIRRARERRRLAAASSHQTA